MSASAAAPFKLDGPLPELLARIDAPPEAQPVLAGARNAAEAMERLAAAGFLTCGSLVRMLMFLELMLNAANIALVALGGNAASQAYAAMLLAVAAAEAGVGLALIIALARTFKTLEAENIKELKG